VTRLVVIGGDAAGMSAAAHVQRAGGIEVAVAERGPHTSYSLWGIPYLIGGVLDDPDVLVVRAPEAFRDQGMTVWMRTEAVDVDARAQTVRLDDHQTGRQRDEPYDFLLVATGAHPSMPDVPGMDDYAYPVRTLAEGIARGGPPGGPAGGGPPGGVRGGGGGAAAPAPPPRRARPRARPPAPAAPGISPASSSAVPSAAPPATMPARAARRREGAVGLSEVSVADNLHRLPGTLERQRGRVDAVALARRLIRRIVEDVAQMAAAGCAQHLGASHQERAVGLGVDRTGCEGLIEAWPAGPGVELGLGAEERGPAPGASVGPGRVLAPVAAAEGRLGALLAQDAVLLGGKFGTPFGVRTGKLVRHDRNRTTGRAKAV
jgi:hypothetical protein